MARRGAHGSSSVFAHLFLIAAFWRTGTDADAHEFLNRLLDSDVCEATRLATQLRGECPQVLSCPRCNDQQPVGGANDAMFTTLSPPTCRDDQIYVSIQECLDVYFRPEMVQDNYAWPGCMNPACRGTGGRPSLVRSISVFPDILCVKLNRWGANGEYRRRKVSPTVRVLVQGRGYTLQSVIVHRGTTESGHYWAVVRHHVGGAMRWYVYNDGMKPREATPDD